MKPQNNISTETTDSSDCLSASELVHRHLKDKNHEISDSDLQKVALDCDEPAETNDDLNVPDATSISMNANEEDEVKDDEKKEKDIIITPLDVIS